MAITDKHLKVITLKPKTSREYLDLMTITVNLQHFYRIMKLDRDNTELPNNEDTEKICKDFLKKWRKIKRVKRKK